LICQEARTAGQIFIYGHRWTCVCVWWFKEEEQSQEKGRSIIMHSFVLAVHINVLRATSWFFLKGGKDMIYYVFSSRRKWKHGKVAEIFWLDLRG
jgi:hypothetical protein